MSNERVLITGGSGTLGTALKEDASLFGSGRVLHVPDSKQLDITNLELCRQFVSANNGADIIIHSAALTNWEKCQSDPDLAFKTNVLGTLNIATVAREIGAKLVHISTDAVFDGKPRTEPYVESSGPENPGSLYGLSKLMAEMVVQRITPDALIIRLGWLFGPTPGKDVKFVGAILRQIAGGNRVIRAVVDKHGSPTYSSDVASKLAALISSNSSGIRHLVNSGSASRYDVAREIAEVWGADVVVEPVESHEFPSTVSRPDYSVMKSKYAETQLPAWQDALARYQQRFPDISDFGR